MKLDLDTLATVPAAPPGAGADRALGAPVPGALAATSGAAVAEGDVAKLTGSPIAADISTAAATRPPLLFASHRRTLGRRAGSAMEAAVDHSGEEGSGSGAAAPAPPDLPATDGSEVASGAGWPKRASWGFISPKSLMIALLLLGYL
ncbi:MAG TPA: hypothetical protein VMF65_21955 [Acidimicrobiales bacterium]|nr:hypothetical protein [Acidimicrobiales bacterium]